MMRYFPSATTFSRALDGAGRSVLLIATVLYLQYLGIERALAQFGGPAPLIPGLASGSVRTGVEKILIFILSFMTLIAMVFVVVGGIRILAAGGNEEQVTKGRKTIVYAVVGLLVIFFSALIVSFFTQELAGQF